MNALKACPPLLESLPGQVGLQAGAPPGHGGDETPAPVRPHGAKDHGSLWPLPAVREADPTLQLTGGCALPGPAKPRTQELPRLGPKQVVADGHQPDEPGRL